MLDSSDVAERSDIRAEDRVNHHWAYSNDGERSLGDLLTGLTTDLSTLLRQEVQLARVETMEKVKDATQSIVLLVVGGFVAYAGFLAIVAALVDGLGRLFELPLWLAALIVGAVVVFVGVILLQSGRNKLQNLTVVPEKTVETMKENVEMIKEKTS